MPSSTEIEAVADMHYENGCRQGVKEERARIVKVIENERLTDTSEIDEREAREQDEAYNRAIRDCLTAIQEGDE